MAQRRSARRSVSAERQRMLLVITFGALALYLLLGASISLARRLAGALPPHLPGVSLIVAALACGAGVAAIILWRQIHGHVAQGWARRRTLLAAPALADWRTLTPTQFELAVGELLRDWGYRDIQHTGRGGDLAADLVCRDRSGALVIAQCKRYGERAAITSPQMQQFIGMIYAHHRADYGIFVTTSSFTGPARALAQQHHIRLIDGAELSRLARSQWRRSVIA